MGKLWDTVQFMALVYRISQDGRQDAARLRTLQERRWRAMLTHAAAHSPFYRRRLAGLNLATCQPAEVPTVTKDEVIDHFDEVVTDRDVRLDDAKAFMEDRGNLGKLFLGRYVPCHTSGTQGQPTVILQTPWEISHCLALNLARGHALPKKLGTLFARLGRRTRMAVVTLAPDFNPSGTAFAYLPAGARRYLDLLWLSRFDPLEENVARLNDFRPEYVTAYASVLEVLAREERAGRLRLRAGGLVQLSNVSELMGPDTEAELRQTFNVPVTNNYSMAECMALTSGCPSGRGAHLSTDLALLEVVDEQGHPVPPGTAGHKVLLTNLYYRVQPFIRYEIGDVVTVTDEPCPCGSRLPLVSGVNGRTADQFWVRVGDRYRRLSQHFFRIAFHTCPEVAEFQAVQTERNRFVVRATLVPGATLAPDQLAAPLRRELSAAGLDGVVSMNVEIVPEIEADTVTGKKRRMHSLVGPPSEVARGRSEMAA
jgi:phenylacetate-coenzyme A ligase PaaK-like adenylate-forming protein